MILNDVIDYLVTTFGTAVTPTAVIDGAFPWATNNRKWVEVAADDQGDGATATLEPSTLGPGTWQDENGTVTCAAWSYSQQSSQTSMATLRSDALALALSCVNAVRADRKMGGLLLEPGAIVSELRYEPRASEAGALARVTFTVSYKALVTT